MIETYIISLYNPSELIEKLNLKPIKIEGVNGFKISHQEIKKNCTPYYTHFGTKGSIGCAMSHIKTWEIFLSQSRNNYCMILEDNVELGNNFDNKLSVILNNLPEKFDIVFLNKLSNSTFFKTILSGVEEISINDHFVKPSYFWGTSGYILSKNGAILLLKYIKTKISTHIDVHMRELYFKNLLDVYSVKEGILKRNDNYSKSSNSLSDFPIILNSLLYYVPWEDRKLSYVMNFSIIRIHEYEVNLINIIFLLIGILCAKFKIDIVTITVIFLIISSTDIFYGKNKINILSNYLLIILPSIML